MNINFNLLRELALREHLAKLLDLIRYDELSQSDKNLVYNADNFFNSMTEEEIYKAHIQP